MKPSTTLFRTLHDLGAAAWFGGALMGAVGLNAALAELADPAEHARAAAAGWGRWAPVSRAAVAAHLVGTAGLLAGRRPGAGSEAAISLGLTAAALGATAYTARLGGRIADPADAGASAATGAHRMVRRLEWAIPVLTAAVVVVPRSAERGTRR